MLLRTTRALARRRCSAASRAVRVHEVAPRDGLQNEATVLPTTAKLELLRRLVASTPASIEVTSFVRADIIPALADADNLCAQLWSQPWAVDARKAGMRFAGLVLNERGFERFLRSGLDTATVIVSCTESHSKANSNLSFEDAVRRTSDLIAVGRREGIAMRGYASMAFGCPFEGETDPARVDAASAAMVESGANELILADTIGVGSPEQVHVLGKAALRWISGRHLGLHMHDTNGRAAENCAAGLNLGMAHFDAAVGGCGGCPFAPGAAGNLATEDLLDMLDAEHWAHGVQRPRLSEANEQLAEALGRPLLYPA
jgi:hydroxymethylglutaryl-CoA lyase